MLKSVEASGKTLDAAIEKGISDLGLSSRSEIEFKVLKDNGFLFNKYKVLVWKKPSEGEIASEFVEKLLQGMGFDFIVETEETEDAVNINLVGTDSASIIGYRGEVLDSIQYLTSLVCNKNKDSYKRLTVDTENYREKRAETLRNLAKNLENKVKRTGRTVKLEPMNPYERRIIHSALQDSTIVTTVSEGVSPNRYVTIVPRNPAPEKSRSSKPYQKNSFKDKKDNKHDQPAKKYQPSQFSETRPSADNDDVSQTPPPSAKKTSMNFVYSSEKKRRKNPLSK